MRPSRSILDHEFRYVPFRRHVNYRDLETLRLALDEKNKTDAAARRGQPMHRCNATGVPSNISYAYEVNAIADSPGRRHDKSGLRRPLTCAT